MIKTINIEKKPFPNDTSTNKLKKRGNKNSSLFRIINQFEMIFLIIKKIIIIIFPQQNN